MQGRPIASERGTPRGRQFDPILAAILCRNTGDTDEACWLLFLAIHCGRHHSDGWALARQLYAGSGPGLEWTWNRVSADPAAFRRWLNNMNVQWTLLGGRPKFGNHRKYVSLNGSGSRGTGEVVETYIGWVGAAGRHAALFQGALARNGGSRARAFDDLYRSLDVVQQFGRLAKFDFLCMLAKCGLADIEPGHAYLTGATGPLDGAKRLFGPGTTSLHQAAVDLGAGLGVGMQVIEDAMCNWVKSPNRYAPFRG